MPIFRRVLLTLVFGLSLLQAWGHKLSYRADDSFYSLWFLVFLVLGVVGFFSPIVCLILGFLSRRSKPIYFFIPFVITMCIGVYAVVLDISSFLEEGKELDGIYIGIVYLLIGIGSFVRRRIGATKSPVLD